MTFEEMLSALAQQTMQINATLQTVATAVAHHETRISQNEELLKQVLITQQAIKDILERLNGR